MYIYIYVQREREIEREREPVLELREARRGAVVVERRDLRTGCSRLCFNCIKCIKLL